jgi:hypothetical protein
MKKDKLKPIGPEDHLLVLLTYNQLNEAELDLAQRLADSVASWEEVWQLADFNTVVPHVYYNLESANLLSRLPGELRERFEAEAQRIRLQNSGRLSVAAQVLRRFVDSNIPFAILKGVLFGETIYKNPYYKRMNDIDLLIKKEDIRGIFGIYEELGLFYIAERIGGSPEKQMKTSHHAPPFVSRDLKCVVGTQWGLKSPLAPYKIDYDGIWERMQDISFRGIPARQMCHEDNLHHLCVHLGYYKTGARDLFDFYNLLRHCRAEFDWDLFLAEVKRAKTQNPVYHALSLANCLCPMIEMEEVIKAVSPKVSRYYRSGTSKKTRRAAVVLRICSKHLSNIEKSISEFNATEAPGEKGRAFLHTWKHILAPPGQEALKLDALVRPSGWAAFLARLKAPWKILRAIANEIGALLLLALMVKSLYDLVSAAVKSPFIKKESRKGLADYAKSLGLSPEDLKELKENIQ